LCIVALPQRRRRVAHGLASHMQQKIRLLVIKRNFANSQPRTDAKKLQFPGFCMGFRGLAAEAVMLREGHSVRKTSCYAFICFAAAKSFGQ
jgi:surfactin synthase thioesterase subunit